MALASFALINHRWKPATLVRSEYEVYRLLPGYLSKETFDQRMNDIEKLIRKKYPHIWLDTHLFALAICLLILAGVFAVIVHIKDIMQWYPLLILIAPAIIAYWTTWRRSTYLLRLNKARTTRRYLIIQMTSHDINSQVKWGYRRLRDDDSAQTLHLADPLGKHRVSLIIEIIQIDMEMQASCEMSELLPSYRAAADDVVLDIGP
ncbi:uncharacterized protein BYT42DRAFT_468938, partial [Radiomyces spectabilis]|uniref:uncharacterized protein n=1 Tax=Radiomyces spectabilis TaxID=64574 RepID=UPI00221F820C